jgi:hypothetical protein
MPVPALGRAIVPGLASSMISLGEFLILWGVGCVIAGTLLATQYTMWFDVPEWLAKLSEEDEDHEPW